MQAYNNASGVALPLALFLATDTYDYVPNTISATGLMKPIRQRILSSRVPKDMASTDIMGLVKSRMGTALHDSVEKAWQNPRTRSKAMESLGYPVEVHDRIVVNPRELLLKHGYASRSLTPDLYMEPLPSVKKPIPVYMEIRGFREFMGCTVSGKFDFVADHRVRDFKSTGTFTWTNGTKTEDYQTQGSIYRWLHPQIIKEDVMNVDFIFTDWAGYNLKSQKNYPPTPVMTQEIPLMTLDDTQDYIRDRITAFDRFKEFAEPDIPLCTDKELWRKEDVYKYYSSGKITARSTKNYPTAREAHAHMAKNSGKGIVVEVKGQVTACKFCPAFPVCTQKDALIADGSLTFD